MFNEFNNFNGITNLNNFIVGSFGKIPSVGAILQLNSNHQISINVVDMDKKKKKNCVDKVIVKIEPLNLEENNGY